MVVVVVLLRSSQNNSLLCALALHSCKQSLPSTFQRTHSITTMTYLPVVLQTPIVLWQFTCKLGVSRKVLPKCLEEIFQDLGIVNHKLPWGPKARLSNEWVLACYPSDLRLPHSTQVKWLFSGHLVPNGHFPWVTQEKSRMSQVVAMQGSLVSVPLPARGTLGNARWLTKFYSQFLCPLTPPRGSAK